MVNLKYSKTIGIILFAGIMITAFYFKNIILAGSLFAVLLCLYIICVIESRKKKEQESEESE